MGDYCTRQPEILPEAPIQKFTGFHNPKWKKINVPFDIETIFSLHNLAGVQEDKYRDAERNCLIVIQISM